MSSSQLLRKHRESLVTFGLIIVVGILTYGILMPELGFYRDDWYQLWAGNTLGPSSIIRLFSIDRPIVGYVYALTFILFDSNPLAWQVYSLALRILGAVAFLWVLRKIWSKRIFATTSIAVLFLIYPGFLQQPNANTFSNQLLTYTLGIISIGLTVAALYSKRRSTQVLFTALAVLTGFSYWLLYEYMIGLEGIRLVLIAYITHRKYKSDFRVTLRHTTIRWMPYLPAIIAYLIWRGMIYQSSRGATSVSGVVGNYLNDPVRASLRLFVETGKDLLEAPIFGWFVPFYNATETSPLREALAALLAAAIVLAIFILYRSWLQKVGQANKSSTIEDRQFGRDSLIIGLFSLFFSLFPVLLVNRDIHWHSGFDRYSLHATIAIALIAVGFIYYFLEGKIRIAIISLLIGLSVMTHTLNAMHWRDFWEAQKQLWIQLSWRAPQLEPGTVLFVDLPVGGYIEDYEIWGPANLVYYPEEGDVMIGAEILTESTADLVRFGSEIGRYMRAIIGFERDFDKSLIISMPTAASCFHVLEGDRVELPRNVNSLVRSLASFSRSDLIDVDAENHIPPEVIFGPVEADTWCFYYQRASLARQRQDWVEAARLGDEAFSLGLFPQDRSEYMPFLEGYVYTHQDEKAETLAQLINDKSEIRHMLCDNLSGSKSPDADRFQYLEGILCEFK